MYLQVFAPPSTSKGVRRARRSAAQRSGGRASLVGERARLGAFSKGLHLLEDVEPSPTRSRRRRRRGPGHDGVSVDRDGPAQGVACRGVGGRQLGQLGSVARAGGRRPSRAVAVAPGSDHDGVALDGHARPNSSPSAPSLGASFSRDARGAAGSAAPSCRRAQVQHLDALDRLVPGRARGSSAATRRPRRPASKGAASGGRREQARHGRRGRAPRRRRRGRPRRRGRRRHGRRGRRRRRRGAAVEHGRRQLRRRERRLPRRLRRRDRRRPGRGLRRRRGRQHGRGHGGRQLRRSQRGPRASGCGVGGTDGRGAAGTSARSAGARWWARASARPEGTAVGTVVGTPVGTVVGVTVGTAVGSDVGAKVSRSSSYHWIKFASVDPEAASMSRPSRCRPPAPRSRHWRRC